MNSHPEKRKILIDHFRDIQTGLGIDMTGVERHQAVHTLLKRLHGLEPLKELLWSELGYQRVNQPLPRRDWSDTATSALVEDPILFASGGQDDAFHVLYARLANEKLLLGQERPVVSRLLREHPYALFIFSNQTQDHWHFVNVKYEEEGSKRRSFRRITVSTEEKLRTASERLAMLDLETIERDMFGLSPLAVQEKHDKAFDVEAVTKEFFKEYENEFKALEKELISQTNDHIWAHDYSLQFLNRCMFLYFIQRKGWLGNNRDFMRAFWKSYQRSGRSKDSFVANWLNVLFFEAFCDKSTSHHNYFPDEIRESLSLAPYLNGGLFTENKRDHDHKAAISDSNFEEVFEFLERYNFTIAEDSPLDKEVAVDPEMIGKVYETLVNVSDDVDARGEAGIFYTPRTEIDLMCRLSLADNLTNHLGEERRRLLNQLIFALEPEEKAESDSAVSGANLWDEVNRHLRGITVLDPACGSGSFLVGMLNILNDLQERANRQLGIIKASYDRKKRIIGQSLYGVDVMEWACHVAELRLWLALIIDADFTREELHVRREPLLPHFSFKVRCGDSLVQEVGGINLGHIAASQEIPPSLKARITTLKDEKLKFYNNDTIGKFHSVDALKNEEKRLFSDILDARGHTIQERIKALRRKLEGPQTYQIGLDGKGAPRPHQMDLQATRDRQEIETLTTELAQTDAAHKALSTAREVPFVWDIAFVEIFEGENGGFDIVMGNPPYVRQESIAAPVVHGVQVTDDKKEYKAKLALSVYQAFPHFFGYKASSKTVAHKINAKSDLYIYFYLRGLSLLNEKGSFCFITSNSWLDVGYGSDLQEFLLKHCHVKVILDNQAKRSFSNADVNTIIALFASPDDRSPWALEKTARFVMFKVPFEHIIYPVIFDEIEEAEERKATNEYRVFPMTQSLLLRDGCEIPEYVESGKEEEKAGLLIKSTRYIGNKWGGKYLRAPDIYWTILEKCKDKLVRLGDVAEVRFGIKTGANEFFYLDEEKIREWGIEEEFLKPVIKSPKECKRILVDTKDTKNKIFICHKNRKALEGTYALSYIKWGEKQGYNENASVRGRQHWWYAPYISGNAVFVKEANDTSAVFYNPQSYPVDCRLYCADLPKALFLFLNSPIAAMMFEIYNRAGLGEGARSLMVSDYASIPCLGDTNLDTDLQKVIDEISSLPARKLSLGRDTAWLLLDDAICNALDLTQGERDAVYEAVIQLVEVRLKKAGSV